MAVKKPTKVQKSIKQIKSVKVVRSPKPSRSVSGTGKKTSSMKDFSAEERIAERRPFSIVSIIIVSLIILALSVIMYFSLGSPSITGEVTSTQGEYNIITPVGFTFSMMVIGAIGVMFTIFLITKEGAGR